MKRIAILLVALIVGCRVPPLEEEKEAVAQQIASRLGKAAPGDSDSDARQRLSNLLEDGVLTADEAVRFAVANNPKLQAIFEDLDIAHAEIWRASLPPNPVVDAELKFLESGAGDLLELVVAQSIIDILLIPRRRQVASERFERVQAEVTGAVVDLATEVRAAYRGLQGQLELVELYRSAADATYFSFEAAERLREAGNIIELEVLQERALYEDTKVALVQEEMRTGTRRENLNALLGLWGPEGQSWSIEPRLPMPEAMELESSALEARVLEASLDLRSMRHQILALGHEVGLKRLEVMFPKGTLGAIGEREADENWSVGPLFSLSLPVFNFGQVATAEARARLRQAYDDFTDLAVRVRRSARSAYLESETMGNSSRYLREVILPLRSRITEQTQRQFNAMQLGVFQLLETRRRELEAGRRYVETLRDHWLARARLEALLLGRLPRQRFGIEGSDQAASADRTMDMRSGGH